MSSKVAFRQRVKWCDHVTSAAFAVEGHSLPKSGVSPPHPARLHRTYLSLSLFAPSSRSEVLLANCSFFKCLSGFSQLRMHTGQFSASANGLEI